MNAESSHQPRPRSDWLATDDELAQVAARLGISLAQDDAEELDGNFSRVFRIGSDDGKQRVLKVRARWITEKRIKFEHALAQYLQDAGLPMVAPLENDHGSTWTRVGQLYCEFAPFVDGKDANPHLVAVHEMGRLLARLHSSTLSLAPALYEPPDFQNQADPREMLHEADLLLESEAKEAWTTQRMDAVRARLRELDGSYEPYRASLPQVLRHGDFHPWNLLFSRTDPARVVALFDLDMAAKGPRVFDIAYAIFFLRNLHPNVEEEWNTRYRRFVEGYLEASGIPLTDDEVLAAPLLMECISLGFVVRADARQAADEYDNHNSFVHWLKSWQPELIAALSAGSRETDNAP